MSPGPEHSHDLYFDTVTLSNFALAGRLDLLGSRYGQRAIITTEVLSEITDGIVAGYARLQEIETMVAHGEFRQADPLSVEEREIYRQLLRALSPGEASCITLAKCHDGAVVSDDQTARGCCRERGIPVTGTIGILKATCMDGTVTPEAVDDILFRMMDAGFYSPVKRISGLIG